jgi:D-alanine transaminase
MTIAYVNGQYLPLAQAHVSIEDRGYQFADGVYEVIAAVNGALPDTQWHLERLERSLAELRIPMPMPMPALKAVLAQVVHRSRVKTGMLYIQVTRGVAMRDFHFPKPAPSPSLAVYLRARKAPGGELVTRGTAVITLPDMRWKRCDIKSISLLGPVLGKQAAKEAGAFEAWLVNAAGEVTEGTSSNAWIIKDGAVYTQPPGPHILNGITRMRLIQLARSNGITVVEQPFTPAQALAADEAFLSASTMYALPVVAIDGQPIGDGKPGPLTLRLRGLYEAFIEEGAAIKSRA